MRAVIIMYEGKELPNEVTQKVAETIAEYVSEKVRFVDISQLDDLDLKNTIVRAVKINSSKTQELLDDCWNTVKEAVEFIRTKYNDLINTGNIAGTIVQMLTDLNNNTTDAEMLKNCITVISEYKNPEKITNNLRLKRDVINGIKTLYNSHLI